MELAFQFNDGYSENILSFVNNVRTRGAGTHESGMKAAMTRVFNDYARRVGMLKEKDKNLEGSDIREGLSAVLSIRVPENLLQFEGQTKEKLGTAEARAAVDAVVTEHLAYFLAENPDTSSLLVKKQSKREKRERQLVRHGKKPVTAKNANARKRFCQGN
ncbi:DNA topoisomerase 4 subunit B [Listeria grayi]|uniref:DNA topoisomerase (ATP-hydrolyzing) n=1 Tax=Listeria grayi TaxID=1641 RepID=A0A378MAZ7_LISGR|nr:DNA topoisomerase 4 subunit B [Listeria grayi]